MINIRILDVGQSITIQCCLSGFANRFICLYQNKTKIFWFHLLFLPIFIKSASYTSFSVILTIQNLQQTTDLPLLISSYRYSYMILHWIIIYGSSALSKNNNRNAIKSGFMLFMERKWLNYVNLKFCFFGVLLKYIDKEDKVS